MNKKQQKLHDEAREQLGEHYDRARSLIVQAWNYIGADIEQAMADSEGTMDAECACEAVLDADRIDMLVLEGRCTKDGWKYPATTHADDIAAANALRKLKWDHRMAVALSLNLV